MHGYVLFMANTGLRPDEASRLEYRDVKIVTDEATEDTILEIEVRGKRGVGYCKSMPGAVRPFRRLRERNRPQPTDRLFPKRHRELFNIILDELKLKFDRDGNRRTAYSLRHTYICYLSALDGRRAHLPDCKELPHQRRDDREVLCRASQDDDRRRRDQRPQGPVRKPDAVPEPAE